jgi:Fe-S cluster assembly ATP-binding protein
MLDIKNLNVSVEEKQILKNLSLNVGKGEVHAIMGPNGSGKSTIAHTLAGNPNYEIISGNVNF